MHDRYINDEAVCQALTGMLGRAGLEARLNAMPVRTCLDELRAGNYDMYLLGWSPGTFDGEHPIHLLVHTPTEQLGTWNFGGYSKARLDALLPLIQQEIGPAAAGHDRRNRIDPSGGDGLRSAPRRAARLGRTQGHRARAAARQTSSCCDG
jgi:hypothetical protein